MTVKDKFTKLLKTREMLTSLLIDMQIFMYWVNYSQEKITVAEMDFCPQEPICQTSS